MTGLTVPIPIGISEPIGDYPALVAAVAGALDRDIDKATITRWIALAEARLNRTLRVWQMERLATLSFTARDAVLPSDYLAMVSVTSGAESVAGLPLSALPLRSDRQPLAYALTGGMPRKMVLSRAGNADAPTTVDVVYYAKIPEVNENNQDNWLLNEHPDIYYYGALVQAEAWLVNDERVPLWKAALDEAIYELQHQSDIERHGVHLELQMSVPHGF